MSTTLVWSNILAYSLQVGLLVAVGAFVPALVRMRAAGARLLYWQLLLAACLLLPWVRPWHQEVIAANVSVTTVVTSIAISTPAPARIHISPGNLLLYLLAAGVVARLAWLAVGFWRLRGYRRRAVPLENAGVWAEVLLSTEISSPVTFGWRRPVILLPERFPELSQTMREAILCHENLHVERRDWLFTVAEELVRAALWFHPAIWWLLAEIQLAREQAVDWRVVQITQERDPYVDALLEMAGARPELDLAPAPLFLRKRHLKQRVVEIIREATMSKMRWITALAASVIFLAAACYIVTGAFPLSAEPQIVPDSPGIMVDLGGAQVVRRAGIYYPEEAITRGIQGTVVVQVEVDADGAVTGASSVSGAHELREAVLQSVFGWHFTKDWAGGTRQVIVTFELQKDAAAKLQEERLARIKRLRADLPNALWNRVISSIVVIGLSEQAKADLLAHLPIHVGDTLTQDADVNVAMAVEEFDRRLGGARGLGVLMSPSGGEVAIQIGPGAQLGGTVAGGAAGLALRVEPSGTELLLTWNKNCEAIADATHGVLSITDGDRHEHYDMDANQLRTGSIVWAPVTGDVSFKLEVTGKNQTTTTESVRSQRAQPSPVPDGVATNANPAAPFGKPTPQRVVVSDAQALDLISQVAPVYPPLAKQARIQGDVELSAVIGTDGKVKNLMVVRGHPLLVQAALDAVRNWVYKPTLLNGEPVEVKTTISINFTLPPPDKAETPTRIRVGGNVQAANLVTQVKPTYPPEAKQAGIQGKVELSALIGKDGTVVDLKVLSGDPLLAAAAVDAVKNWVYRSTLLNGEPVEVQTTMDVNFTLQ